ncbi:MAG: bifunctional metallophosphatase/5'-nucleotidase [Anaerotignum sp.]|nr:bifunctional metallophosphatase/5'-nucleotidase [Anaerotignum sp.]
MKGRKQIFAAALAALLMCPVTGYAAYHDDIIILYTNDTHCGIEENIGFAGVAAYKKAAEKKTPYVTLVDCGDAIQGDFIGLTSEGGYIADIMNAVEYDFAVPGNHEFDYGMDALEDILEKAEAEYLSCNITYTGKGQNALADVKPYKIERYGDVKVGFIGVTTPYAIGSSTPMHFMENGEYVYDFANDGNGQELYDCVQKNVDACRRRGTDYVVVLAHLGDGEEYAPFSSAELARETKGIDVILDGHAHRAISCMVEENKDGKEVLISSAGTKFENIGQLVITAKGNISTGLISSYGRRDAQTEAYIDSIQATYEADLQKVVAVSETTVTGYTADGIRLVRNRETAIGNFCADAYRWVTGADIALVNGGGVRGDLPAGDVTYQDIFTIHPYGNSICMVEATGQEILDCLEMCYRKALPVVSENGYAVGEDGGFQQVSGLKLTVDTAVPSSVTVDENEMFLSVEGERRVRDVMVLNEKGEYEPLDSNKIYTLASHNYLLKEGGSGCGMFADNHFLIDESIQDYQALADYMTEGLNGKIGLKYAQTEGRITIQ